MMKAIDTRYNIKTYSIELDEEILGFVSSWKSRRGLYIVYFLESLGELWVFIDEF